MKKIVGFFLLIILISFFLLLLKYLVIEEILGFYLIPILLVVIVASILYLLIRIFKKISYKVFITNSLLFACVMQIGIMSLVLWCALPRFFSREKVVRDIDYAIKIAIDVHPDLFANISKESFYAKTDSIKKSLPEKISDAETYKTFCKIFSLISDGHTSAGGNFYTNRLSLLFRETLPYKICVKNERLYVAKNYFYRNTIPVGSEIIAVNGKPSYQCLNEISQLISYENILFRNSLLEPPLIWGLWNDFKKFEITYKTPDAKTIKTIKTSGGLISKILAFNDEATNKDYSYKTFSGNIGYMEFNSSVSNLANFKTFLLSTFKSIKDENIEKLIIDIRRNGGGDDGHCMELMQYISKTDFRTGDSSFVKISTELLNKGRLNWIDSTKRIVGSLYKFKDTSRTKLRENPLRYKGQTFLLIGESTFSSASEFASIFQCNNVGKLIGTETGGLTAYFGEKYTFELPNTKYDMEVACKKFYEACGMDNRRGILPDYNVENSFEDDKKGIDRVLEFTIDLIRKNKK